MMTDNSWWASCRCSTKPCQDQVCWGAGAASLGVTFCFFLVPTLSATMEEKSIRRSRPRRFSSWLTSLQGGRSSGRGAAATSVKRQMRGKDAHGGNCSLPISSMASKRLIGSLSRSIDIRLLPHSSMALELEAGLNSPGRCGPAFDKEKKT